MLTILDGTYLKQIDIEGVSMDDYAYDTAGNMIYKDIHNADNSTHMIAFEWDRSNRMSRSSIVDKDESGTYTYDDAGRLTQAVRSSIPETYSYDIFGRIVSGTKGNVSFEYTYDANGLRTSKTVDGATTYYVYDGENIIAEISDSGETIYLRDNTGIVSRTRGNAKEYFVSNYRGDISAVVNSNADIIKSYDYEAFGSLKNASAADDNPFRYCGEYFDDETGFVYLRNRYYDTKARRFIQEDPARDELNWYAYCENNPVNYVDPWGLEYIVASGGNYGENHGYKYNFIEPAIKKIRELRSSDSNERIAWCIANTGWNSNDWKNFQNAVDGLNVNIIVISDTSDFENYINYRSTSGLVCDYYGNNINYRTGDEIKKFAVFSHGFPDGTIALGYNYNDSGYNKSLDFKIDNIANINADSFNNPNSWFYSCNTARGGNNSFLKAWHDKVGGFAGGYDGYTSYYNIMGLEGYNRFSIKWRRYNSQIKSQRKAYGFSPTGSINYPTGYENARQVTYR